MAEDSVPRDEPEIEAAKAAKKAYNQGGRKKTRPDAARSNGAPPKKDEAMRSTYESGDLKLLPDPDYLIAEAFQKSTVTILHAPSTQGKTQVCLAVGGSVAWGATWGEERFKRGLCMYVCCENFKSMKYRYQAWCKLNGYSNDSEVDNVVWYDGETTKWDITSDSAIPFIEAQVDASLAKRRGLKLHILVIDHLSKALRGNAGQSRILATRVMDKLEAVAQKYDCAVILIAHTNKTNRGMANSATYVNFAQAEHRVESLPGNVVRVCGIKQRDAAPADIIFTRRATEVRPISKEYPRALTSAALVFEKFETTTTGQEQLSDTAYQICVAMERGEFLSYADLCRRLEWGIGGAQNKKIKAAVDVFPKWKKFVCGDVIKAICRRKIVPAGAIKEVELIACAAEDDLSVYPLSEQPQGGTGRPRTKPRKNKPEGDAPEAP